MKFVNEVMLSLVISPFLVLCCVASVCLVLPCSLFAGYCRIFRQLCGKHMPTLFGLAAVLFTEVRRKAN